MRSLSTLALATLSLVGLPGALGAEAILAVTFPDPDHPIPRLLRFDSATPHLIERETTITGLDPGEIVEAIDFQPATGRLFGLGSTGLLYSINQSSGAAFPVGSGLALAGNDFGFDFSPVSGFIRVVSDADENFVVDPDTGVGSIEIPGGPLAYFPGDENFGEDPTVTAIAYDNNVAGAGSTTLYGIDTSLEVLVRIGSPGGEPTAPGEGFLFTVGPLSLGFPAATGFDVSGVTGVAYASFGEFPRSLFTIDLTTGAATLVGLIGDGSTPIRGLAVIRPIQRPPEVPALSGIGLALLASLIAASTLMLLGRSHRT